MTMDTSARTPRSFASKISCEENQAAADGLRTPSNNSLDRGGGSMFRIKRGAAKVSWIRAARSTLTLGGLQVYSYDG